MPHGLGHRDTGPFAYDSGSVADDAGSVDSAVANTEFTVYEFDVYAADTFTDDAWSIDARTNACYKPPYAKHTGFGNDNCDCKTLQSRNERKLCIFYA